MNVARPLASPVPSNISGDCLTKRQGLLSSPVHGGGAERSEAEGAPPSALRARIRCRYCPPVNGGRKVPQHPSHALDYRQAHDQAVGSVNQAAGFGAMGFRRTGPAAVAEAIRVPRLAAPGRVAVQYSNLIFCEGPPSPLDLAVPRARREPGQRDRALLHPGAGALLEDAAVRPDMRDGQRVTDGLETGERRRQLRGRAHEANGQSRFCMSDRARRVVFQAGMRARNRAAQRLIQGAELRIYEAFQRRVLMRDARTRYLPPVCTSAVHCMDVGSENAWSRCARARARNLM